MYVIYGLPFSINIPPLCEHQSTIRLDPMGDKPIQRNDNIIQAPYHLFRRVHGGIDPVQFWEEDRLGSLWLVPPSSTIYHMIYPGCSFKTGCPLHFINQPLGKVHLYPQRLDTFWGYTLLFLQFWQGFHSEYTWLSKPHLPE